MLGISSVVETRIFVVLLGKPTEIESEKVGQQQDKGGKRECVWRM